MKRLIASLLLLTTSAIGQTLSVGTWYRLAFSWSGGANWQFYVNGVMTSSGTNATTIANGINRIGANISGASPVEFFHSDIGFIGFSGGAYDSAVDTYMAAL
jgi:hypothetical protein